MRKTHALIQVAVELLSEPDGRHWVYDVAKRAGVRSGVAYPLFSRMLEEGWLIDGWEDPATIKEKRPPRRYYELTEIGKVRLGGLVSEAATDARFASLNIRWAQ